MMHARRPVLVATDLSARCDRAIDRAQLLAREWNVPLNAVHTLDSKAKLPRDTSPISTAIRASMADTDADLNILLPVGSAPETIITTAEATDSAIIVMGIARYNHLTDYFLGTAVDYVVRMSRIPVLVVKQRPHRPYRQMLFATDFSECSRTALLKAAELFPAIPIYLIHAWRVPFSAWLDSDLAKEAVDRNQQKDAEAFLKHPSVTAELQKRVSSHLAFGETETVVAKALVESDADLVVLGTRRLGAAGYATVGSTAEALLSLLIADILMIRD